MKFYLIILGIFEGVVMAAMPLVAMICYIDEKPFPLYALWMAPLMVFYIVTLAFGLKFIIEKIKL